MIDQRLQQLFALGLFAFARVYLRERNFCQRGIGTARIRHLLQAPVRLAQPALIRRVRSQKKLRDQALVRSGVFRRQFGESFRNGLVAICLGRKADGVFIHLRTNVGVLELLGVVQSFLSNVVFV